MKSDPEKIQAAIERFVRIGQLYVGLEKKTLDLGSGEVLHPSELHFLEAVGKIPEIGVVALSHKLGVTKGAASQMAGKLASKGYVEKRKDPDYPKEVQLVLTKKGQKAFAYHQAIHQKMDAVLAESIQKLTDEQYEHWMDLMTLAERYLTQKVE